MEEDYDAVIEINPTELAELNRGGSFEKLIEARAGDGNDVLYVKVRPKP